MANIQIICPHCETPFKYRLPQTHKMKTLRVRPGPNGSRFEFMATVDANVLEAGQFTRLDDLVLFPTGAAVGAALGLLAYVAADGVLGFRSTEPLLYFTGIGGGAGLLLTQWWLCDEAVVRRKAWRWFQELQSKWLLIEDEDKPKPVVLEVSHRERDGGGEQGRTIQYFGQLPVNPADFIEYVKAIMAGGSLAINQWVGSDKPFERSSYEALLAILRDSGAVINLGGNKGHQVTTQGRRAFRNYLRQVETN